jgi:hypothetical protein
VNIYGDSMKNELKEELEKKFITSEKFCQEIEQIVLKEKMNYIDAIVFFCDKNTIEVDTISKLVSKPLKEKLKWDAIRLNFMKKTSKAKLPL